MCLYSQNYELAPFFCSYITQISYITKLDDTAILAPLPAILCSVIGSTAQANVKGQQKIIQDTIKCSFHTKNKLIRIMCLILRQTTLVKTIDTHENENNPFLYFSAIIEKKNTFLYVSFTIYMLVYVSTFQNTKKVCVISTL